MLMTSTVSPLFSTETTKKDIANGPGKPFTSATIHYIEEQTPTSPYQRDRPATSGFARNPRGNTKIGSDESSQKYRPSPSGVLMNGYTKKLLLPSAGMYVRALYDYEADDRTSLSFRQGDIIQVITQLESGWWDGVIHGIRGWFPSNYCALVNDPSHDGDENQGEEEGDTEEETEDDYEEQEYEEDLEDESPQLPMEGTRDKDLEEAAFWIPQATPDGRLFYFNTLTGISTMELPLETPTSATESGPRDRMNVNVPDQTRLPPEMMARGYERDEDEQDYEESFSASEREGESLMIASQGTMPQKRQSYMSDGMSPATSVDSISRISPIARSREELSDIYNPKLSMGAVLQAPNSIPAMGTTTTSFTTNPLGPQFASTVPRSLFDDNTAVPLTWNRLVENMRLSVERYRQAIDNGDRSDYVRKAEDISDHLRLLLAAGSGTTDNHSGNPSIISTNKALYPHFRDMMSKFSKLVLSSHIAASDWPTPDSYAKCLQEADGVLHGVYGYVEVARQQRGEDLPRLVPGFVIGSNSGGNWHDNGLGSRNPMSSSSFMDQDEYESFIEPTTRLDSRLLERMDDLKRTIVANIRKLDEQLMINEKIVSSYRHEVIGDIVCAAGGRVLESFQPWIATTESINLAPLGSSSPNPQLLDFDSQKQRLYDLISDLLISCQVVAGPLGDEWAEVRGDSLEDRLYHVRSVSSQLETCTSQLGFSLQLLLEMMPQEGPQPSKRGEHRKTDGGASYQPAQQALQAREPLHRPVLTDVGRSVTHTNGVDPATENYGKVENSKVKKFFGEVPALTIPSRESEEGPSFLKLDYEAEIAYDTKTIQSQNGQPQPPQIRGGTLTGLVEQLTRHDRLDSPFNNTFLLTYRSFTSATELFDMLVKRFSIQPPSGLAKEDYQLWVERKQQPIRMRVVNILKSWFDNYWMEGNDEASKNLMRRVHAFAKDSVATTSTPGAQPLMAVVEQRLRGQETNAKRLVLTMNAATPTPIMPKNMKKLKFLDIDVTEFARQLTIIESRLYGKIKPTECLNKTWQKKIAPNDPDPAANVKALILHSNQLTNWVAEMILTQQDVKKRVVVIKHFVNVADRCRALNNFSTLTSIISALGTAPIHRLKRTWDQVHQRTLTVLEQMRRLMGSTKNFGEYRETLHLANPPCIPFFGVYLTDLTFIEDGIPSVVKKTNHINFNKRAKTAEVIRDIQQYQNVPYPLQPVPELQEYILSNMQAAGDVHEMYDKSLSVEPREREDEKIARYARYTQYFSAQTMTMSAGAA